MKKKLLFAATVAAMLASCSGDNLSVQTASQEGRGQETAQGAVGFDAYLSRATSRNGAEGELKLNTTDADAGKVSLEANGFGVFGYYTDNVEYEGSTIPNFMWNQKVAKTAAGWEYHPVMYWPNEFGSANAGETDRVSFFAYAPYVEADVASGKTAAATDPDTGNPTEAEGTGITAFSRNDASGDPLVKYVVSLDPKRAVDLCWGTVGEENVSWTLANADPATQTFTKGLPWLDVQRPKLSGKVRFQFEHALAQLNIQVKNDVDIVSPADGGDVVKQQTRVWIRSITLSGLSTMGALNLNNTAAGKAKWLDYYDNKKLNIAETCTVFDGRGDGREGTVADPSEQAGINPALVQTDAYDEITAADVKDAVLACATATSTGVTSEYQNVFSGAASGDGAAAADAPIYVIPNGGPMRVTIAYDVETYSPNLAGYLSDGKTHGKSVSNVITKDITISDAKVTMENGKKYTLKLHLGLNGVKFDAEVTSWQSSEDDDDNANAELPTNGLYLTLGRGRTMTVSGDPQTLDVSTYAPTVTWTTDDDQVVDIREDAPSPTRGRRAGTRAEKMIVDTSAKRIWLIPRKAGTATITCTCEQGTASVVITVVKLKATPATVTPVTGLTVGDSDAELITVDNSTLADGTMRYAVTATGSAPADGDWSATVPTVGDKEAGTYQIWYKAVPDDSETYDPSDAASVSVTIVLPPSPEVTPTVGNWGSSDTVDVTPDTGL